VQKGAGTALGSVIAEGDFRRTVPDSFKRSSNEHRSNEHPPLPPHPLGQIRNNPPVWAELLHIGRSLFASQFSVEVKLQISRSHIFTIQLLVLLEYVVM